MIVKNFHSTLRVWRGENARAMKNDPEKSDMARNRGERIARP